MVEYWVDTEVRKLIAAEPGELQLDRSSPTVVPLHLFLKTEDFPFKNGDFESPERHCWTKDKLIELGGWALQLLQQRHETEDQHVAPTLTQGHIERLHVFGLAPDKGVIPNAFGSFWRFREALGIPTGRAPGKYSDWSLADYVTHADGIARRLGRKPRKSDYIDAYNAGVGPNAPELTERVGGVRALNELIGFPNVYDWSLDEYISWGVRVMEANDGVLPSQRLIDALSKRKRGPSASTTAQRFGNLQEFQRLVQEAWELQQTTAASAQQAHLQRYKQLRQQNLIPEELDAISDIEKVQTVAKFMVAKMCLPSQKPDIYSRLARTSNRSFIAALRKTNPKLTAGYIEMIAVSLDVFDYIWHLDNYQRYLRVSAADLPFRRPGNRRRYFRDTP